MGTGRPTADDPIKISQGAAPAARAFSAFANSPSADCLVAAPTNTARSATCRPGALAGGLRSGNYPVGESSRSLCDARPDTGKGGICAGPDGDLMIRCTPTTGVSDGTHADTGSMALRLVPYYVSGRGW